MKPKNKEDVIFNEKMEELDNIKSPSIKKLVREAKRKLKKQASKSRRRDENKIIEEKLNGED